ncbi:hypothetical protein N0V95_000822 [Ascochyta clinopodiicola]|nr:hypothetical protein N0V95_000822 [Ascochyta clinopodiicola]
MSCDLDRLQDKLMRYGTGKMVNLDYEGTELDELVETTFQNPVHQKMYYDWVNDEFKRRQNASVERPATPASNYFKAIATTNFLEEQPFRGLFILGVTTNGPSGDRPGTAGEVWLLYSFTYWSLADGRPWEIPDDDPDWGYLERDTGDGVRRAGMKIANSFAQLNDDYSWDMEKYFTARYHVSPAILDRDEVLGTVIVRQDCGRQELEDSGEDREDVLSEGVQEE